MSGKPTPGKKPPFVQHQVEAKRIERESEEYKANRAAINAIADQINAYQAHQEAGEKGKGFREWLTIWLLIATTGLSLIAASISAYYGHRQHTDNIGALERATQAVQAAKDQATISSDTEHRQLRAYVGMLTAGFSMPGASGVDRVTYTLHNFGSTPAMDIEINYAMYNTTKTNTLKVDESVGKSLISKGYTILYPTETITPALDFPGIIESDEDDIRAGRRMVFWYGTITYSDIFGEKHTTEFCQVFADRAAFPPTDQGSVACINHRDGT